LYIATGLKRGQVSFPRGEARRLVPLVVGRNVQIGRWWTSQNTPRRISVDPRHSKQRPTVCFPAPLLYLKSLLRFDNLKPDRTLVGANCAALRWALTASPGRAGSKRQIKHTSKQVHVLSRARPVFDKLAQR
jgi:hypothetical protein